MERNGNTSWAGRAHRGRSPRAEGTFANAPAVRPREDIFSLRGADFPDLVQEKRSFAERNGSLTSSIERIARPRLAARWREIFFLRGANFPNFVQKTRAFSERTCSLTSSIE